MLPVARMVLLLAVASAIGLAFGQLKIRGVGLGIGGVLFGGLAIGHLAHVAKVPLEAGMLAFIRDFGLILFVYTIGIQVGPGFFAALRRSGAALNGLALLMVASGTLTAAALPFLIGMPLEAALGVLSGAATNAPALAAARQVLSEVGAGAVQASVPGLAFAVTYPFGIAGNLLTMAFLRFAFRIDVGAETAALEAKRRAEAQALASVDLAIGNAALDGVRLGELTVLHQLAVVASRMRREGQLQVPTEDTVLRSGDILHLVGSPTGLKQARLLLGGESVNEPLTTKGSGLHWVRLVVTERAALGRSIAELGLSRGREVAVSRVNRAGVELVPTRSLKLQFGDILTVVGRPEDTAALAGIVGNSQRRLQQVEMVPLFIGVALGAILGSLPLYLPGMPAPLRLGLAGGPLIVALLLARLGTWGPLVWFMPPTANLALREIGIVLFLAVLGIDAGGRFFDTLAGGAGPIWLLAGAVVTLVPLLIAGVVGRAAMKLDLFTLCGVLAGAQTNPPGLAYAAALGNAEAPALAYATVYPLAMCLRILAPQVLVLLLY
ncbi:MAG: putative transporter [Magnetospirillum sp.]|nr:putative transporter [Magnetospirillum sp.]